MWNGVRTDGKFPVSEISHHYEPNESCQTNTRKRSVCPRVPPEFPRVPSPSSKETRDGQAETGIGAVVAVSAGSAVVVVRGVVRDAASVAGGAALLVVSWLHLNFVEPDADVLVPVFAGVSDVLAPVWSRACPAAAGTSDRAWGCPCLEERTAREGRVRWHALDDPHSAADRHSLCDWRAAARSALPPPLPSFRPPRGILPAAAWPPPPACP